MKLILVYMFSLAAHLIHANDEPQSKVMDGENLSRIAEHDKSGNFSRRVESPRTLPISINDAIYESELVKDAGVRDVEFEKRMDRSVKLNPDDSEPINTDDEDEVSKSGSQTTDGIKLDNTEDVEKSTPTAVTSRRAPKESVKKDPETSSEVSESNIDDVAKTVHKNEDTERAAKNTDNDKLTDDSTLNNQENLSTINDNINSRDSSSEGYTLISGHRRMLYDDEILDTKARSGQGIRSYGAINSQSGIKPAQPFSETESPIPYQRLKSPIVESPFPVQQSTLDLASHEFAKTSKHDRNTYEYNGSPAQMQPINVHSNENIEKVHIATLAPMATPTKSRYTNIQRNADSIVTDPFLLNILKMADITKNSNRFYFPSPPVVTTPMMHPYLLQRYPPLQLGTLKLY